MTVAVTLLVCTVALAACASDAPTTEMAEDPADVTVPGVPPTAPTTEPGAGLSDSGNALLAELDAIGDTTDLCTVLTGEAFSSLLSEDVDVTSLVTSPAGITQLFVLVDQTFEQLVVIAPPEVAPAMQTIRDVWRRVAALNAGGVDAEQRTAEILAEPQVIAANQSLLTWATFNCSPAAGVLGGT